MEEQLDKALLEGRVGCFCTQNCWDTEHGRYMYDIFRERGNLQVVFSPRDSELTPQTNHIEFSIDDLQGLNAVVVELQDVGTRYFNVPEPFGSRTFFILEQLSSYEGES